MSKKNARRSNLVNIDDARSLRTLRKKSENIEIIPRTDNQGKFIKALNNEKCHIAIGAGPAGTGKTWLAVKTAINHLIRGYVDKIVITRPVVGNDEELGFLPGDLSQKMAPWTRPIFDVFEEHYMRSEVDKMVREGIIEIAPLSFIRGRTFKNCFIIIDEAQNCTPSQIKSALTRIGEGTKITLTGDLEQHDRGYEKNGLKDFITRVQNGIDGIEVTSFVSDDIQRHPLIGKILEVYAA